MYNENNCVKTGENLATMKITKSCVKYQIEFRCADKIGTHIVTVQAFHIFICYADIDASRLFSIL